jgi:hypothetical protein
MTDFQLALMALGFIVVICVVLFNWWQERKFRRAASQAFSENVPDALMPDGGVSDAGSDQFAAPPAEPDFPQRTENPPVKIEPLPPASELSEATWTISGPDITAPLTTDGGKSDALSVPVIQNVRLARMTRVEAFIDGHWVKAGQIDSGQYRVALQLADRGGKLGQFDLSEFSEWLAIFCRESGCSVPEFNVSMAMAAADNLDDFCNAVDIQIAMHVKCVKGPFLGTRIRALAESGGLKLEEDGNFRRRSESGGEEFRLVRDGGEKFQAEAMREMSCSSLILEIDIPTAAGGMETFNRFRQFVEHLSGGLSGTVVDDNGAILSPAAFDSISRQLAGIYKSMIERGIAPGGPEALRLFA